MVWRATHAGMQSHGSAWPGSQRHAAINGHTTNLDDAEPDSG
jgi:hypothetical protein